MNRKDTLEYLLNKSGGKCMSCGRALSREDAVMEHIFPIRYGGSDRIENLKVLCRSCNCAFACRPFREAEFQQYLQKMLSGDPRFKNVCVDKRIKMADGQQVVFDIVFSRASGNQEDLYVVETKGLSTGTADRIQSAIQQLRHYREAYPSAQFILAVPVSLTERYHQLVQDAGFTLWDGKALQMGIPDVPPSSRKAPEQYDELIHKLKCCEPGYKNWQVYQKLVGEILSVLFCPPLDTVSEQNSDASRTNRRDFILPNYAACGYWPHLRDTYKAEFIVVDAKNAAVIRKDDILQVAHYLKRKGPGLFALIFSRHSVSKSAERHLRDVWQNEDKMMIVLDDNDVEQMLLHKQNDTDPCQLIIERIQEFRLKI